MGNTNSQAPEFSRGKLASFAAVTILMAVGFWTIMNSDHGGWGVAALVAAMVWTLGIMGFGDVFRVLYDFSVVVGMIAMMVFSFVVGIPRTVTKAYERLRTMISRK